jgi:2-polyprenyl-6-methoxyphenol hydroxylase-like FAD-dependent oxidoreductase
MATRRDRAVELLIAGAGPVGLFAALVALRRGLSLELIDQSIRGFGRGYAALLHPGSLRLLDEVGVLDQVRAAGRELTGVGFHVDGAPRVGVEFRSPALAVTQAKFEDALLAALRAAGGSVTSPLQATTLHQNPQGTEVRLVRRELATLGSPAHYSEWEPVESWLVSAGFVLGADGYESRVRTSLGLELSEVGSTETFAMFEGPLPEDVSNSIEIGFSQGLVCSMLPLPDARARFAFQLDSGLDAEPDLALLQSLVRSRAPFFGEALTRVDWGSVIHFERRLARRFGSGRVWLAGDAAHITSPIGAQSMNLGLVEAHGFVERIAACRDGKAAPESLEQYGLSRQREWHKLLGFHVKFELEQSAPAWLGSLARKIPSVLPASGSDLKHLLSDLGLRVE